MNHVLAEIRTYLKKPSARREAGVFVAEGPKMVQEAPPERIRTVVASESFLATHLQFPEEIEAKGKAAGREPAFYRVRDDEFERISDTKTPQGVLAVLDVFSAAEETVLSGKDGFFLLLDAVQDPGNAGTILRLSEAAGVSGVIFGPGSADVYNPKTVRATMGAVFRVPFARTEDLGETIRRFRDRGGKVYAAHLKGSIPHDEAEYRGLTAVLLGNESRGLSEELADLADGRIRIPMLGKVESLNVAMAATVIAYEALRQRKDGNREE